MSNFPNPFHLRIQLQPSTKPAHTESAPQGHLRLVACQVSAPLCLHWPQALSQLGTKRPHVWRATAAQATSPGYSKQEANPQATTTCGSINGTEAPKNITIERYHAVAAT
eukprot:gnl/MRDRNA2_/MRDRNA2_85518_c0_seq1.p1 gnl/MRDRNA2_/MRDRNA2_85518_c0~~gnl/MRDRNA2_/MRDRNA2_85518_c0_seq1.p1  ORF type:complete len:110 (-),score=8.42 gnl/MRDRNA2_/MRDRNA2_85518_c0_seq1:11-340(-)